MFVAPLLPKLTPSRGVTCFDHCPRLLAASLIRQGLVFKISRARSKRHILFVIFFFSFLLAGSDVVLIKFALHGRPSLGTFMRNGQ